MNQTPSVSRTAWLVVVLLIPVALLNQPGDVCHGRDSSTTAQHFMHLSPALIGR